MKYYGFYTLTWLVIFGTIQQAASQNDKSAQANIKTELARIYALGKFNGFSVAVVNDKGTLYESGVGYADNQSKQLYTENTIQNIGSISKTFVGIALVKAQELGKLKLDEPINKYLPFAVENPFHPEIPITIRQLATHTSTITDNGVYLKKNYILKPGQDLTGVKTELEEEQTINPYDSVVSLQQFLKNVLYKEGKWYRKEDFLPRKPGEIFEYSNVGTALAAYIVERATAMNFADFTSKYILKPLKMKDSGWNFAAVDFSKHSHLYYDTQTPLPFYSLITYPDGNFITSAHDLSKFLSELINGYSGNGKLLSEKGYKEYFTPQLKAENFLKRNEKNPFSDEYNIGIFMGFSVAGNIGHTGGDPGVSSMMFFDPKTKIGRLLIVNTNINDKQGNDAFYAIWNALANLKGKL